MRQGIKPEYRERQDANVALMAKMQIEYCEQKERERQMARKPAKATQALKLMEALSFVELATEDRGSNTAEFVNLSNKQAITFDGTFAAGMEIEEELSLAPKLEVLKKALAKSGKSLTITELPTGRLSVKGEKLSVMVPCVAPGDLPDVVPDPAIAPLNDEIKEAFKALVGIIAETGERFFETALLLEANLATATNGKVLMQYWHGNDLPPNLILPRPFVKAVASQFKSLKAFGWTQEHSVTFWFEDNSWYKTQVYQDKYPDVNKLLDVTSSAAEAPATLWEGCAQIAEFDEYEWIEFKSGEITSGTASWPVEKLQGYKKFDYKQIKKVIPYITKIDLTTYQDRAFFFGDKVRGVAMGIVGDE